MIPFARLLILHTLRQPAAKRDWKKVAKVLTLAEKFNPDDEQVPVLCAEILVEQGRPTDAEKLLEQARVKNPKYTGLWIAQVALFEHEENWDKAEQLIEEAQKTMG